MAQLRVFKTAWFGKAARKALLSDAELCRAIREVVRGKADDLGGGVFKKRLDKNRARGIILAKGGKFWIYAYLSQRRIAPTSVMRSSMTSESWQKGMPH